VADDEDLSGKAPGKNQQFAFLNSMRRERTLLDVYLVNGTRLRGRIRSFDQYSMIIETGQGDAFLYHHTVSSVGKAQSHQRAGPRRPAPGAGFSRPADGGGTAPPYEAHEPRRAPQRTEPADVPVVVRKPSRRIEPNH
jgi:host factor-I protein